MIISIIILLVSFLLDGILSNLLKDFICYFFISALIICSLYNKNKNFYYVVILFGLLYDLCYTPSLFLNTTLFLIIFFISNKILDSCNIIKVTYNFIILITLYTILMFIFTIPYNVLNINLLINKFLNSIIINYCYLVLIYLIIFAVNCLNSNSLKKHSY